MQIEYETQRLSLRFFMLMLVLFIFQVVYGMILAAQQVDPTLLVGYTELQRGPRRASQPGHHVDRVRLHRHDPVCRPVAVQARTWSRPWLIKFLFYAVI